MARVDPGGRIILDRNNAENDSWLGHTCAWEDKPGFAVASQAGAEAYRVLDHNLSRCEIVPVMVVVVDRDPDCLSARTEFVAAASRRRRIDELTRRLDLRVG